MKLNYLKEKKESVSTVLLWFSAFLGVLILIKVGGFFVASANAKTLVEKAFAQSKPDANDMEKYFAKSKAIADELKKKNLFAPPTPKKNPVSQVLGILGSEALINGKWYKVGDNVGDARVVAIEPALVRIEWDGREKTFAPMQAAGSSDSGGPRSGRPKMASRTEGGPGAGADMVVVGPGGRGTSDRRGRFGNLSDEERTRMRERFQNMSEEERQAFREQMRERFGGRRGSGGEGGRGGEGRRMGRGR